MTGSRGGSARRSPLCVLATVAVAAVLTGSCGGDDPAWSGTRLSDGYAPASVPVSELEVGGTRVRLEEASGGLWLSYELPPERWRPAPRPGVWMQTRRAVGEGAPQTGAAQRLLRAGTSLSADPADDPARFVAIDTSRSELAEIDPGVFCAITDAVFLVREPDAGPPTETLRLHEFVDRGHADEVGWRVPVGTVEAEGLPLFTGERVVLPLGAVEGDCVLSFWTTARDLAARGGDDEAVVTFRAFRDDALVFEWEQAVGNRTRTHHHRVPVPADPGTTTLRFELEGAPSLAAIHAPRLRPSEIGTPADRTGDKRRPDLLLVVADTYRADNLAAYGGDPRIAPELDALAARGTLYARTWATSPWTLPSHASLFTGVLPPAAGCMDFTDRLGDGARTLAEVVRDAGYRTVAVTDRGFVSRDHGLAQGFEWFQEVMRRGEDSLEAAIEDVRAQLEADDGRPLFLFFQTYRAHTPYFVTEDTRAELAESYAIEASYRALADEILREGIVPGHPRQPEAAARAEALYRGASRDTSRGLGELVALWEARGLLENGHVFVTSDHGEAFNEHGLIGHGSTVHEAQIRIPLLHVGTGVPPSVDQRPASLLDVPSTLVALAGVLSPREWMGTDLRRLPDERVLFAFVGDQETPGHRRAFAAREEDRKLYFLDEESEPRAFALDVDPDERRDVYQDSPWAPPLTDRVRSALPALTTPLFEAGSARLSAEAQRQLDELGYTGG